MLRLGLNTCAGAWIEADDEMSRRIEPRFLIQRLQDVTRRSGHERELVLRAFAFPAFIAVITVVVAADRVRVVVIVQVKVDIFEHVDAQLE